MADEKMMAVDVYCDTTGLYTEMEIETDNICELEFPERIVKQYFMEYCLENFKGDDPNVSDDGLYEEWLDEYTCDDTDGLVAFAEQNGFKPQRTDPPMYVQQYSIDIDDGVSDKKIKEILEANGIIVRGIAWRATWTSDGYDKCEAPIASD